MILAYEIPRQLKAVVVLGVLFAGIAASGLIERSFLGGEKISRAEGIDVATLVVGVDPMASLDRLESLADSETVALPHYFEEEVGLPDGSHDARVSCDGVVVGYVLDELPIDARRAVCAHMTAHGWSSIDLGVNQGVTFMKSAGSCTWGLATFTQVGGATSVVFRCVVS